MRLQIFMVCFLAMAGSALSAEDIGNKTTTEIFIQEGASGSFVADGLGNYTLTMNEVVPYTIYFSDRPERDVGFTPMEDFLKGFSFEAHNPPNAAIILPDENESSDILLVELTRPQYNNTTRMLTYKAKQLKDYSIKSGWLQDHASEVDAGIPEKFSSVRLVIDSCPCLCVGSGAGCDATCYRNSCYNSRKALCEPCGGCCHSEWECCPCASRGC